MLGWLTAGEQAGSSHYSMSRANCMDSASTRRQCSAGQHSAQGQRWHLRARRGRRAAALVIREVPLPLVAQARGGDGLARARRFAVLLLRP